MKRFISVICIASLLVSITGCNDNQTSSNSSLPGTSTTDNSSKDNTSKNDPEKSDETSDETSQGGDEVAYTLNGELTPTMISNSRLNEGNKVRLTKVIKKLENKEEVTVAYIGGSITQGSSAGNELCYSNLTTEWLKNEFKDAKITYVNAGIGATGSYIGVHRADEDLLSKKPDLVFVEFSVNDTTENTERNKNAYDSLINKIWASETNPAIITIAMTMEDGTSFQDYHAEIVKKYDIPMISYKNTILDVINKDYIKWADISDDNIHPNVAGHKILAQLIESYLSDTIKNVDTISGDESNLSEKATKATMVNGSLLRPDNSEPALVGFEKQDNNFGNFQGLWRVTGKGGDFAGAKLTFEVEAKEIGVLFGKLVNKGGTFDVLVDGEKKATINTDFANGWGNYVEATHVASFEKAEKHTVEIVPVNGTEASIIFISALAIA